MTCWFLPSARPIALSDCLPTLPHIGPLRGRQLPSSLHHEHHLQERDFYQVVLHRPLEPARFITTCRAPSFRKTRRKALYSAHPCMRLRNVSRRKTCRNTCAPRFPL